MSEVNDLLVYGPARVVGTLYANNVITFSATITLTSSGWSGSAPYTQTVSVPGMTADMDVFPTLNIGSSTAATVKAMKKAFAMIDEGTTANGYVTFKCCNKKPTVNIPLYIKCV